MKTIDIAICKKTKNYTVFIGNGIVNQLADFIKLDKFSSFFVITDSNVAKYHLERLKRVFSTVLLKNQKIQIFEFSAGEKSKTLKIAEDIYNQMTKSKTDRKSLVINLGGGVVCDLGGFTASTFLRGLNFINIPSTLESMVDASVGGKTGVNLGHLKNYIGTIAQPYAVIIDLNYLTTLPKAAFVQGYAEVIKHGLVYSKEYFDFISSISFEKVKSEELIDIIEGSIKIKASIVTQDESESNQRKLLNFGHTVGHAVESDSMSTASPLFHGEAVTIGMVAEAYISKSCKMIGEEDFIKIESLIKNSGLPIRYKTKNSSESIFKTMKMDKKNSSGKIKWTLLTGIGSAKYNVEVAEEYIRNALQYILN